MSRSVKAARLAEIHRRVAAHRSEGNVERAAEELDAAFRIDPGDIATLKDLGEVAVELCDFRKAKMAYRALLLQDLEGAAITKNEALLRLGEVHLECGEKRQAAQNLPEAA